MKDLLQSEDFARYRKKQTAEVVTFIKNRLFKDDLDPEYLKGAIEMARRLIRLPIDMTTDEGLKSNLDKQTRSDLDRLVVEMVREDG